MLVAPAHSYRTAAYVAAAQALQIELVLVSEGEQALVSGRLQGLHFPIQGESDLQPLLDFAHQWPIDGVVATDDASVVLTSRVAGALGLPCNPPQAARRSRRKDLARHCLHEAGIPVPAFRVLDLEQSLAPQVRGFPFPAVIKPIALSGSLGVIRVDDPPQLQAAIERIKSILQQQNHQDPEEAQTLLLEQFIPGVEIALEGLLQGGCLRVLTVFDKPEPMNGPYFEESYYISPSRHSAAWLERARKRVQQACQAYGLQEGPVHAELRFFHEDAWIMEVASRTIGGYCSRLLSLGTGHSLESLVLQQALGRPLSLESPAGAAGVLMLPTREAGILRRVEGVMAAQAVPFVEEVLIAVREGYELQPLPDGNRYLGFVFARAPDADQVERALRAAQDALKVVVAPLWKMGKG